MICKFCKHYQKVDWKRSLNGSLSLGCSKANLRHGTDGYGPWYSSPNCKHDSDASQPKDLFEPIDMESSERSAMRLDGLQKIIYERDLEIQNLNKAILAISKKGVIE